MPKSKIQQQAATLTQFGKIIFAVVTANLAMQPATANANPPKPIQPESWFTVADNLPEATRLGLEGNVTAALNVSETGKVTACNIDKSSGHALLDEHSCKLLLTRARLQPATDDEGNPTAGVYLHPIRWNLITHTNWAANGIITAEASYSPARESDKTCYPEIQGQMSQDMLQMACFILINQAKTVFEESGHSNAPPIKVGFALAVSPIGNEPRSSTSPFPDMSEISKSHAKVTVNAKGERTDCAMIQTNGPSRLIFPICTQLSAFRYIVISDQAASPTSLHQTVTYYAGTP